MKIQGWCQSEKAMAAHSSTFAWRIPCMEEPGGLQSMGSLESDMTGRLHFHFSLSCIGEGNGNPLQCSCLENPRDGGAWWAAVYGVAQSRTQLRRLSSSSSSWQHSHLNDGRTEAQEVISLTSAKWIPNRAHIKTQMSWIGNHFSCWDATPPPPVWGIMKGQRIRGLSDWLGNLKKEENKSTHIRLLRAQEVLRGGLSRLFRGW